jgi:4'-phosphopantetheinyl transferase EntD
MKERLANRLRDSLLRMTGPGVGCSVLPIGSGHPLPPEEGHIVANAIESRRSEFATGRACARTALGEVSCPPLPILRGQFYEPIWPRGFTGSITHDSVFAAAIAYRSELPGHLGIDLVDQADLPVFIETASTFLTAAEQRATAGSDPWCFARIFSAKEAAIKILSTRMQTFMDFHAIETTSTPDGVALHVAGSRPIIATFTECDGTLITLAVEQNAGASEMSCPQHVLDNRVRIK